MVDWPDSRSLRSDGVVVQNSLRKLECADCGLVRSGDPVSEVEIRNLYATDYSVGVMPEHLFYTDRGPVSRSRMICDWIVEHVGEARLRATRSCLEIGAGSGRLLQELSRRGVDLDLQGVEPGSGASAASARGLVVHQGGIEAAPAGPFDGAYSVAVIEHVASPTAFLREARSRLRDGGWLCLVQPTQDVPSYDLFFVDHLSHFGSAHLSAYAEKAGFRQLTAVVGHPWMPNFSLHVWEAVATPREWTWSGQPHLTRCRDTARRLALDASRLDDVLTELERAGRGVAVFGTNEVYSLARAYTSLTRRPLVCALDDAPERVAGAAIGLPVVRPEEAPALGVDDVVLTMNAVYYALARARLDRLGLVARPFLTPL